MNNTTSEIHVTPAKRKRIDLTLPPLLLETVDRIAQRQEKDRTAFIEDAIREKLNSMNVRIKGEIDYPNLTNDDLETTEEQYNINQRKTRFYQSHI
jgi:metal-responsive CopG/Arc/MetJ family transcriptional regulator